MVLVKSKELRFWMKSELAVCYMLSVYLNCSYISTFCLSLYFCIKVYQILKKNGSTVIFVL